MISFFSKWRARQFVVGMLLLNAILVAWEGYRDSPTWDEIGHFAAGLEHWKHFRFRLFSVNPPLVRLVATLPFSISSGHAWDPDPQLAYRGVGGRPEFSVGSGIAREMGYSYFQLMTVARWMCIPFSVLGGLVCYQWSKTLWGTSSGYLALVLWTFSPTVLAYAHFITPDLGGAAMGVIAAYTFRRWLICPTRGRMLLSAVTLGLAELTKTTWVVLFVLWPLLWGAKRMFGPRSGTSRNELIQLAAICLVGIWVLNVGYGFEGSFKRLQDYVFISPTLTGKPNAVAGVLAPAGNRFSESWLGTLPIPFPENYVLGIDYIKMEFDQKRWSYLDGVWKLGGWPYYYLACLAYKEPLGNWGLMILASGVLVVAGRKYAAPWREELLILAPLLTLLIFISSQDGFSHHIRYILPIFPFCCIHMGRLGRVFRFGPKWLLAMVVGLLGWSILSSLSVFPHHMSYFNELAGGPKNGYKHLSDSNVDWGQDLLYLRTWYDKNAEARPLHLIYDCALIDPKMAGVTDSLPVPIGPQAIDADTKKPEELGPQPGWYCLSIKQLHFREKRFVYFEDLTPVDWVGYTMPVYHITLDQANALRRRYGIPELSAPGTTRPTTQPATRAAQAP